MLTKASVYTLLFVLFVVLVTGCSENQTAEVDQDDDELKEIVELTKRYMADNSVLFLGGDAAAVDGATAVGLTSTGIPYAQFTGEEASTILAFGMLGAAKTAAEEPYECSLHEDAGIRAQRRFARCVKDLLNRGFCIHGYKPDDTYWFSPDKCRD